MAIWILYVHQYGNFSYNFFVTFYSTRPTKGIETGLLIIIGSQYNEKEESLTCDSRQELSMTLITKSIFTLSDFAAV